MSKHTFQITGTINVEADGLEAAREKIVHDIGAALKAGRIQLTGDTEAINNLATFIDNVQVVDGLGDKVVLTYED